ncbi:DNA repair protein RecN [Saccharicrinis sp. FJH62]|uniref:DNA repair protein RecN n=1 Tax=Saccharicrinis sp. FJH62 TaxID=3344657 RepID=UPI0035D473BE
MLRSLSIRNFALIQNLNIGFHNGMSVITGETGAGKSIMLGALNMILGQRADLSAILTKDEKCVVEAQFSIEGYGLEPFFKQNDLDFDNQTIIRREITPAGKSRAFVNDTPVTLDILKLLTESLIDIHSQHENLLLNDSGFQLQIIDGMAQNTAVYNAYQQAYQLWFRLKRELQELKETADNAAADKDYFQFQFDQLAEAVLTDKDEQEILEAELEALTHAEEIKMALSQISGSIDDETNGALNLLTEARNAAHKIGTYLSLAEELEKRLESVIIELKDIAGEAELKANDIEYLPERIEEITDRLNLLNDLQHKHRVGSVEELILLKEELETKLTNITGYEDAILDKEKDVNKAFTTLEKVAGELSGSRKKVLPQLEKKSSELLQELGMPNGMLKVQHETVSAFTQTGKDRITFLFSSNKKHEPQPLSKIASGGEKSRLMLALKSLLSSSKALPTIIFDEIDTGISGGIAAKMGKIMQRMGEAMQVVTITHLPQIAACGSHHYKVFKLDGDKPSSNVVELQQDERLHEIATLLSSENVTETALNNARELMENN